MIFHDENLKAISRILRGIEISDETLALSVIDEIAPQKDYLGHAHTLKHFRTEYFFPKLFDRRDFEIFEKTEQKDIQTRALEMANKILADHQPKELDKDILKQLDNVMVRIRKKFVRS